MPNVFWEFDNMAGWNTNYSSPFVSAVDFFACFLLNVLSQALSSCFIYMLWLVLTWRLESGRWGICISQNVVLSLSLHLSPPWYSFLWLILLYWPPWKSNISAELKEINSLHWGSSFLHLSLETLSRCKLRGNYRPYLICCSSPGDPALPVFQYLKTFV